MFLDLFRLLAVIFRALSSRRRVPGEGRGFPQSVLKLRVRLRDLDLNLHMNNSRYLAAMDLGRWDLFLRMGVIQRILRERIQAVVVDLKIRYRKELRYRAPYELRTALLGLAGRKLWVRQEFLTGGKLAGEAEVGILFLKDGKVLSREGISELFQGLGYPPPPELAREDSFSPLLSSPSRSPAP